MHSLSVVAIAILAWTAVLEAAEARLTGRVYEAGNKRGIPNLAVHLVPQKSAQIPERISVTDYDGNFWFKGVAPGRYLVEVNQGATLVHREVISISGDVRKEIPLERVPPPDRPRPEGIKAGAPAPPVKAGAWRTGRIVAAKVEASQAGKRYVYTIRVSDAVYVVEHTRPLTLPLEQAVEVAVEGSQLRLRGQDGQIHTVTVRQRTPHP